VTFQSDIEGCVIEVPGTPEKWQRAMCREYDIPDLVSVDVGLDAIALALGEMFDAGHYRPEPPPEQRPAITRALIDALLDVGVAGGLDWAFLPDDLRKRWDRVHGKPDPHGQVCEAIKSEEILSKPGEPVPFKFIESDPSRKVVDLLFQRLTKYLAEHPDEFNADTPDGSASQQ
jgi:hypothetical protein